MEDAIAGADDKVEIAILVEIEKPRGGGPADVDAVEGIVAVEQLDEIETSRRTGIEEKVELARAGSDDQVKVAVAVDVGEPRRDAGVKRGDTVEGLTCA